MGQNILVSISLRGAEKIEAKEKRLSAPPAKLGGRIPPKIFLGVLAPEHYASRKFGDRSPRISREIVENICSRFANYMEICMEIELKNSKLKFEKLMAEIWDDSGV